MTLRISCTWLIFALSVLALPSCAKPPAEEIAAAELAFNSAKQAGADRCAPEPYKSAEEMLARTYRLNEAKEYDAAKEAALMTKDLSEIASSEARKAAAAGCLQGGSAAETGAVATPPDGARLPGGQLSEAEVRQELAQTKTGEGSLGAGITVQGLKPVHFAFDRADLTPEALAIITENAEWMKDRPGVKVQIEGHTDEQGPNEYNTALGLRRAQAVRNAMLRLGIEPERLSVITYGEEMPVDPGHDESAWSKNRRAEFVVKQ